MFHEVLSDIMIKRNLSQKQIAAMSGLTESSISRFLSGERLPGYQVINNIANGLNIDPGLLFNNSNRLSSKNMKYAAVFKYGVIVPVDNAMNSGNLSFSFHISENIIDGDIESFINCGYVCFKFIFVKSGSVGIKMSDGKYNSISAGNIYKITNNEKTVFIPAGTSFTYNLFSQRTDKLSKYKDSLLTSLLK